MPTKDLDYELYKASGRNDINTVQRLIQHGAHVNWTDSDGDTTLMVAASKGSTGTVKILLDAGADVNAKSSCPYIPGIVPQPQDMTALMYAASNGHVEIVNILIEYGADVNAEGDLGDDFEAWFSDYVPNPGYTALMFAAQEGHLEVVKLLISYGANVNTRTQYGLTAVDLAKTQDIAKLLFTHGAKYRPHHGREKINHAERAAKAWPILVECARTQRTITYSELARHLGVDARSCRFFLQEIQRYCVANDLPPLQSLVVKKSKGKSGSDSLDGSPYQIDHIHRRVFAFDWKKVSHPIPFFSRLISEDEVHLFQHIQEAFQEDILLGYLTRRKLLSLSAHDILEFCKTSTWTVEQVLQYIRLLSRLPSDKIKTHPDPEEALHKIRLNILRERHERSRSEPSVDDVLELCNTSKWTIDQVIEYTSLVSGLPKDTEDPELTLRSAWSYTFGMQ